MGIFGHGFGQKLLNGVNAMSQRYGEMSDDPGALARLRAQQEEAAAQREMAARRAAPQGVPLGNGGYGTWSPEGGLQILREPERLDAAPKPTALQQQIEYIKSLNPNLTPEQLAQIATRGVAGYGYSPEAIGAKEQSAARLKGIPTYSNMHPHTAPRAAPKPPAGFILDN